MAAKLTVIYWRDIPTQVVAQKGRTRHSVPLDKRFQEAVDSAAMFARKTDANAYMEDWRKDTRECSDDLEAEAKALAEELNAQYSKEELRLMIKSKGLKSDQ